MDEKERKEKLIWSAISKYLCQAMASFHTWFIVVINTPDTLLSSVHISLYPTLLSFHPYLFGVWQTSNTQAWSF